jgi:hypothetical protein
LAYANGQWIEVGGSWLADWGADIETSLDGFNWFETAPQGPSGPGTPFGSVLNAIAYGNGNYVAVGGEQEYAVENWFVPGPLMVLTSTDGITWIRRSQTNTQTSARAVAYGNGRFVLLAGSGVILQSDPIIRLSLTRNPGVGLITLSLEGPTGMNCTMQSSSDLISWQDLINITSVEATTTVGIPFHSVSRQMFYRASTQ